MKALIAIAALALTGCANTTTVYEVSAGYNVSRYMPWSEGERGGFDGADDLVRFAVRNEHKSGAFVELAHTSHLSAGWPVNSEREDWVDSISIGYRFTVSQ